MVRTDAIKVSPDSSTEQGRHQRVRLQTDLEVIMNDKNQLLNATLVAAKKAKGSESFEFQTTLTLLKIRGQKKSPLDAGFFYSEMF